MTELREKYRGLQNLAAGMIILVLAAVILKTLAFIFIPFSMALLLYYALGMPIEFLVRFKLPNYVRIVIVVFAVLVVLFLLGRLIHVNILQFQQQLPLFEKKFWEYNSLLLDRLGASQEDAKAMYESFLANLQESGLQPFGNFLKRLGGSFFGFLGNCLWVLLFFIFFLAEQQSMTQRLTLAFGKEQGQSIIRAGRNINKAVQHYLGLKTMVSFLTGFLVALMLWLLDVPFALLWGVLAFIANFIPNIGSLLASVPPIAMTLFQSGSLSKTMIVTVLIITIQMAVGNFLEPKLMGRGLNLSPLVVLLALIFWGWMWGLTGMLLAVPLTAAIKIGLEQNEQTRSVALMMSGK